MTAIPKRKRVTDRRYLQFVKEHDCLVRNRMECLGSLDPHHITPVSIGGSDYRAVPLCRKHHDEAHASRITFEQKYAILFDYEIEQLQREYRRLEIKAPRKRADKRKPFKKKQIKRAWCRTQDGEILFPIFESKFEGLRSGLPIAKLERCQIKIEGKK